MGRYCTFLEFCVWSFWSLTQSSFLRHLFTHICLRPYHSLESRSRQSHTTHAAVLWRASASGQAAQQHMHTTQQKEKGKYEVTQTKKTKEGETTKERRKEGKKEANFHFGLSRILISALPAHCSQPPLESPLNKKKKKKKDRQQKQNQPCQKRKKKKEKKRKSNHHSHSSFQSFGQLSLVLSCLMSHVYFVHIIIHRLVSCLVSHPLHPLSHHLAFHQLSHRLGSSLGSSFIHFINSVTQSSSHLLSCLSSTSSRSIVFCLVLYFAIFNLHSFHHAWDSKRREAKKQSWRIGLRRRVSEGDGSRRCYLEPLQRRPQDCLLWGEFQVSHGSQQSFLSFPLLGLESHVSTTLQQL